MPFTVHGVTGLISQPVHIPVGEVSNIVHGTVRTQTHSEKTGYPGQRLRVNRATQRIVQVTTVLDSLSVCSLVRHLYQWSCLIPFQSKWIIRVKKHKGLGDLRPDFGLMCW